MNTTKLFFMAALALTFAACSSDDNDIQNPAQPAKAEGITITAKLAPKSGGAATRAVADKGDNKITATWAQDEKIAILYEVSSTKYVATANIDDVDANGVATITFAVDGSTPDDTPCTLVYPAKLSDGTTTVYKDDLSGVKDAATLLAAQDGTLNANLDVRVGAGKILTTTPSLTVTTQPAAQYSIFKFTVQDLSAAAKAVSQFTVSDGSGNVITTVTPTTDASELYVALPALATGTYWFNATVGGKPYIAKATVSTATSAGKFYSTTVQMATIGDVIKADGKFYAAGTADALAKITYVGSDAETSTTYNHGLALALSDVSGTIKWCSLRSATCLGTGHQFDSEAGAKGDLAGIANTDALVNNAPAGHTHAAASAARNYNSGTHPTGTSEWFLPSAGQWDKMIGAAGLSNLGLPGSFYWSSSEYDAEYAWLFYSGDGSWSTGYKDYDDLVRACLAF